MSRQPLVGHSPAKAATPATASAPAPRSDAGAHGDALPSTAILFNERSAPEQVIDIIDQRHAFVRYEGWETVDEQGRPAWLLLAWCETATQDELLELVGGRLPDYIRARQFPPSQIERVRREGTPMN